MSHYFTTMLCIKNNPEIPLDSSHPIYAHSVHQFLNPSFPAQSHEIDSKHAFNYNPIRSELDLVLPQSNKAELSTNDFNSENNYHQYSSVSNSKSVQSGAQIFSKPSNSLKDSVGLLKLAGCNIYGRMYRVGRIISELSGPCLECKCTDVGVHCTPLNC